MHQMQSMPQTMQTIAWNRMLFQVPAFWRPTVILHTYLFFEADHRPAMAIKWQQQDKGAFQAEKIRDNLTGKDKRKSTTIQTSRIPTAWYKALPQGLQAQAQGFTSTPADRSPASQGLLLHDSHTGMVLMVQYFLEEDTLVPILTSLEPQALVPQSSLALQIFDIKANLPPGAVHSKHEFVTGRYTLEFTFKKQLICLVRLKPASILLKRHSLAVLAKQIVQPLPLYSHEQNKTRGACIHREKEGSYQYRSPGRATNRWLARLRRQYADYICHIRHEEPQNTILAVILAGNRSLDPQLFEEIIQNFQVLPTSSPPTINKGN